MTYTPQTQYSVDDPENPRYRCCCQCYHLTTGSIAIAVVEAVFILFYALRGVVFLARGEHEFIGSSVVSVIAAFVGLAIVGAMLFGVLKEKKYFLVPFLVAQVVVILIQLAMVVVCIVYISWAKPSLLPSISATDYDPRDLNTNELRMIFQILMGVVLGVYLLGACLGMWFFYIVLYCYAYFKEKELAKTQGFALVSMRPGSSTDIP